MTHDMEVIRVGSDQETRSKVQIMGQHMMARSSWHLMVALISLLISLYNPFVMKKMAPEFSKHPDVRCLIAELIRS